MTRTLSEVVSPIFCVIPSFTDLATDFFSLSHLSMRSAVSCLRCSPRSRAACASCRARSHSGVNAPNGSTFQQSGVEARPL